MTKRYPGGYITKTAPTVSTTSAPGIWTMEQQAAYQKAGTWPFGGPFNYIEDVFSTWLYTGNGSTQTITNGIDLSGNGGMVWLKARDGAFPGNIFDTVRNNGYLETSTNRAVNGAGGGTPPSSGIYPFNSNGFTFADGLSYWNSGLYTYVSWTFRKQPKFFDVVTYTGNGTTNNIAHALASVPGCLIVKKTSTTGNWIVITRDSSGNYVYGYLNTTGSLPSAWAAASTSTYMTSTTLNMNSIASITAEDLNASGVSYVAYLFAHNAGGFGLTGTDNVISCGSYTGTGTAGLNVTLGYEPQWVMVKNATTGGYNWLMFDTMRGMSNTGSRYILADSSSAEGNAGLATVVPTATGFTIAVDSTWSELNNPGNTYVYIAIRRGPMKTPTSGTSVFSPNLTAATTGTAVTTGFPVDLQIQGVRPNYGLSVSNAFMDRLRGLSSNTTEVGNFLAATSANAEVNNNSLFRTLGMGNTGYNQDGYLSGTGAGIYWNFRRAPGFFDVVCYTGTGVARTINHNLGVPPELIITKRRDAASTLGWMVSSQYWYASTLWDRNGRLNQTGGLGGGGIYIPASSHSATQYPVDTYTDINAAGGTFVAYLFASCPGVSKVGIYSGTGATQTIACGFAARFVMIKRADDVGNWWVWDTARGMVAGTDPRLALNSTAAESNANWVYTDASGFQIVTTDATVNASGGSYIYLAIA